MRVLRLHNPGEYIEDDALMRIVKLDPLYVEAILPMRLFGRIEPGMSARVIPELDNGKPHLATVDLVDPMGDAGSGTFGVRLSLPNPERAIPAGLKCRGGCCGLLPLRFWVIIETRKSQGSAAGRGARGVVPPVFPPFERCPHRGAFVIRHLPLAKDK